MPLIKHLHMQRGRKGRKASSVSQTTLSTSTYNLKSSLAPPRKDSLARNLPPPVLIYDVRSDAAGVPVGV